MQATASNPAKIVPSPLVWFRYNKGLPLVLLIVAAGAAIAYFVVPPGSPHHVRLKIIPFAALGLAVTGWIMIWQQAFFGDANPGLVLEGEGGAAVAVLVNMSKNGGMEPAIRIRSMKVLDAAGRQLPPGTPLAMVCHYGDTSQNKDRSRWGDVNGVPANCFTDKSARVAELIDGFGGETWEFFSEKLSTLPSHRPGIYFLRDLPAYGDA